MWLYFSSGNICFLSVVFVFVSVACFKRPAPPPPNTHSLAVNSGDPLLLPHRRLLTFCSLYTWGPDGESQQKLWSVSLGHLRSHTHFLWRSSGEPLEFSVRNQPLPLLKGVFPGWQRWLISLLFQSICLLWPYHDLDDRESKLNTLWSRPAHWTPLPLLLHSDVSTST